MPLGILKAQHKAKDMKPIAKILHLVIVAAAASAQANSHNKRCQQRRQRRMVPSKKLFFHTFLFFKLIMFSIIEILNGPHCFLFNVDF
jgi:hypothetical protein